MLLYINEKLFEGIVLEKSGGRCTGPTQKASSSRPSKKWMQCVKNPDGDGL